MNISKVISEIRVSKDVEDRLESVLYELRTLIENYYMSGEDFTISYLNSIQKEELKANFKVEGYDEYFSSFVIDNLEHKNPLLTFNDNVLREKKFSEENILDLHNNLMENSVSKEELGKYREKNVYVGVKGHKPDFIPPNHELVPCYMKDFVKYLNDDIGDSVKDNLLIKSALAHYFFVHIHPFVDGNGRMSRMLQQSVIWKDTFYDIGINLPPICISNEFNKRKEEYFSIENMLSENLYNNEAWNEWLIFNLDIISDSIYEISKNYKNINNFYDNVQDLKTKKTR